MSETNSVGLRGLRKTVTSTSAVSRGEPQTFTA